MLTGDGRSPDDDLCPVCCSVRRDNIVGRTGRRRWWVTAAAAAAAPKLDALSGKRCSKTYRSTSRPWNRETPTINNNASRHYRSVEPYDDTSPLSSDLPIWAVSAYRTRRRRYDSRVRMVCATTCVVPVLAAGRCMYGTGFEPSTPSVRCRDGDVDTAVCRPALGSGGLGRRNRGGIGGGGAVVVVVGLSDIL